MTDIDNGRDNYVVLESDNGADLARKVSELRATGWNCVGGVAVALCVRDAENTRKGYSEVEETRIYAQAMARDPSM